MFSVRQKREISEAVQKILRETKHPELPEHEIEFKLMVWGRLNLGYPSHATIQNNKMVPSPDKNPHNERQDGG